MAKYFYGIRNFAEIIGTFSGTLRRNDTKTGTIPWDKVPGVTEGARTSIGVPSRQGQRCFIQHADDGAFTIVIPVETQSH